LRPDYRALAGEEAQQRVRSTRTKTAATRARNQRASNKNQRRQQHLLDVRVRSSKAVQQRNRRILVGVSKIVLLALVCGGIIWGVRYGAQQLFFDNPEYRLAKIDITTDGTLQRDRVLEAAELQEGVNIFSVNLAKIHERLQQLPQVDQVTVVRKLPSEISIRVVERRPIGWITADKEISGPFTNDGMFLVDARGVLMKEKKLLPEYLGLPVIIGCTGESLEAGKTVQSFEAKTALELLRLSTRSFMQTRFQVRQIDVSSGFGLVVTDKNHAQVTFGFNKLEQQLQRLEKVLVYADDSRREIATVNLMVERNIPVTWAKPAHEVIADAATAPPLEPKILKALPANPTSKSATTGSKSKSTEPQVRRATPVERGRRN
jgi:cell division protein FtsQ